MNLYLEKLNSSWIMEWNGLVRFCLCSVNRAAESNLGDLG